MDDLTRELERAAWHVGQAAEIVARQLALVHALRGMGYTTAQAKESTLDTIVSALKALEDYERLLRDEIAPRGYAPRQTLSRQ